MAGKKFKRPKVISEVSFSRLWGADSVEKCLYELSFGDRKNSFRDTVISAIL